MAEDLGLSKSMHERLMYGCGYDHIMLDTQYRMSPALSQFPSRQFYDGKLINAGNVMCSQYVNSYKVMGAPVYTVYQIIGKERQAHSGSMENELEARAVVKIVETIQKESRKFTGNWCASNRLRIITFYQAQVALIKKLLRQRNLGEVLVATVDSSQGCEADLVIVSFVRSEGQAGRNSVGFLTDDRRLNVSITRAKYQMMILGNIQRMSELPDGKADTVKLLALDALERKCVLPFPFDSEQIRVQENDLNQHNVQIDRKLPPECLEPAVKGPRKRMQEQRIEPRKRTLPVGSLAATKTISTAGEDQRASVDERKVASKSNTTIDLCSSSSSGRSSSSSDSSDSDSSSSSSTSSTGDASSTELSMVESRVQSVKLKTATQNGNTAKSIPSLLYVNHKSDPDGTSSVNESEAPDVTDSSGGELQVDSSPGCDPPGLYSDTHYGQHDKTLSQNDPEIIYLSSSSD
jgi:hypothetical protein